MDAHALRENGLQHVADALHASENLAIIGHVGPDGDCIGSQLALAHALRRLGKDVTCLIDSLSKVDSGFAFLPGYDSLTDVSVIDGSFETFVMVDVSEEKRIGEAGARLMSKASRLIIIDHHRVDPPECTASYIDSSAAAAGELVWQLIAMLLPDRTIEEATCSYTALMTDTGRFQFQNTNADVLRLAAEMVEAGADPSSIATNVYQSRSLGSLLFESQVIERLVVSKENRFAISWIALRDYEHFGIDESEGSRVIDSLRSLDCIDAVCLLKEQLQVDSSRGKTRSKTVIKGSLRSKTDFNVLQIAFELGGGGHKAAAGFTLNCSIEDARERMWAMLTKAMRSSSLDTSGEFIK